MLKGFGRRLLGALGIATATGAAIAPQAAEARNAPALWSVSDADTTVYLFGTIHLLPEHYQWRSPALDKAVNQSQELVVETLVDDKNPQALVSTLMRMALASGLPPIDQRVDPSKRAALDAAIAKSGIPKVALDRMKTWAAAFMLLGDQFRDMGLKAGEGVEPVLKSSFTSEGKPIGQLETNAEQLGFFDSLPEKAQRALLEGAVELPEGEQRPVQRHAELVAARRRQGDRAQLQPRSCRLPGASRCPSEAPQCQLGAVDRGADEAAWIRNDRGRRRASCRRQFRRRSPEARRLARAPRPVGRSIASVRRKIHPKALNSLDFPRACDSFRKELSGRGAAMPLGSSRGVSPRASCVSAIVVPVIASSAPPLPEG